MWWCLFIGSAQAATFTVGQGQSYSTISAAVQAATDGDTILIKAGVYTESILFAGRNLTLTGVDGRDQTFIDPPTNQDAFKWTSGENGTLQSVTIRPSGGRAFDLANASPSIQDVLIQGGGKLGATDGGAIRVLGGSPTFSAIVINASKARRGGGFQLLSGSNTTLNNVEINDTLATWGGGLFVQGSTVNATNLRLNHTRADYTGGGFYLEDSELSVTNLSVQDVVGDRTLGTGAALLSSTLSVIDGTFARNEAIRYVDGYTGGGLYAEQGSVIYLERVLFDANAAAMGGAISLKSASTADLVEVSFTNNVAQNAGGAIDISDSSRAACVTCTFQNNGSFDGGAIAMTNGGRFSDNGSYFESNTAQHSGGAIHAQGADKLAFISTTFIANDATVSGGALYATHIREPISLDNVEMNSNFALEGDGGAIATENSSALKVSGSLIERNQASIGNGGGIAFSPNSPLKSLTLTNTKFGGNHAGRSGGAVYSLGSGLIHLDTIQLLRNTAIRDGGALFYSRVDRSETYRSLLFGNTARFGGALYESNPSSASTFEANRVVENSAIQGAGLYLDGPVNIALHNNNFIGNNASTAGAHLYATGGLVNSINNIYALSLDGGAIWGDLTVQTGSDFYNNDLWQNAGGDFIGQLLTPASSSGNLSVDPLFQSYSLDNYELNDNFHLNIGSQCIDAGNPGIRDVDGSASDIGAYGGANALVFDRDQDGSWDNIDCDDTNPDIHPGAIDIPYDGIDQDCNGSDLEDADNDGYLGFDGGGLDCNDYDDTVYPGAPDVLYDGVDSDCAGDSDFDFDLDGFDSALYGGDDCDDTASNINPVAIETYYDGIDQNCDGLSDFDRDQDAHDASTYGGDDCNDTNPAIHPLAPEVPYDGIDQNCDGQDLNDLDGDGFTAIAAGGSDCDDEDPFIYPGAMDQWYDNIDSNCDGKDDWDQDGDGFDLLDDCDDLRPDVYPGAPELPNGIDDNCDGELENTDDDGDGLDNLLERAIGTDPNNPDSDHDGVPDGEEVPDHENPLNTDGDIYINALDFDDDGDGIPTSQEQNVDVDGDGIPDPDVDDDGVPNYLDHDTDGDDIVDQIEGLGDEDKDGIPNYADYSGKLSGGGGCNSSGGAPGGLLFLPLFLFLRRRKSLAFIGVLSPLTAAAGPVNATGLHMQGQMGETGDYPFLTGVDFARDNGFHLGVGMNYAHRTLMEQTLNGRQPIVSDVRTLTVGASGRLGKAIRLDAVLPARIRANGAVRSLQGMGDARVGASVILVPASEHAFGVGFEIDGWLPTGTRDSFMGASSPGAGAVLSLGRESGVFGWVINVGARSAPRVKNRNLIEGPGPLGGVGLHVRPSKQWDLTGEITVQGEHGWRQWPMNFHLTGRRIRPSGLWTQLGWTLGMNEAMGTADWAVSWSSAFGTKPTYPEPIEFGESLMFGDKKPVEPVVPTVDERLPEKAAPPVVEVSLKEDRIVLTESLFFREGSATLLERSDPALHAIRRFLFEHDEITHLLIEGHTNNNGSAKFNLVLGEMRAKAVVDWLIKEDIENERLLYKSYGYEHPIVSWDHPDAMKINRRVEFVVLRSDELPEDVRLPTAAEMPD